MSQGIRNPFVGLVDGSRRDLPQCAHFGAAGHLWRQPEIDALTLAHAARRPLLVRGEAGSGKSQIARAAAAAIAESLIAPSANHVLVEVIHPRYEAMDLLYQVDTVARLADAQIADTLDVSNERYVRKGRLWEAFEQMATGMTPVLLIDEIDKADADVPNSLLDVLGNRSFAVPPLANKVISADRERWPVIIITTNEERELPPAFVRRCVVLNLNPPKQKQEFIEWLVERGKVQSQLVIEERVCETAARQVWEDREASRKAGYPLVGLAEYIDLLSALHELFDPAELAPRAEQQQKWLTKLGCYALVKHATQDQKRSPVADNETND